MNLRGGVVINTILVMILFIAGFILGYYYSQEGEEINNIEDLSINNENLQQQVVELQTQISDIQNQINSTPQNLIQAHCQKIKKEYDDYLQNFQTISCNTNSDCTRLEKKDLILSCDVCVSKLINPSKIKPIKEEFEKRKCSEFFPTVTSCTSALYPCACSNNNACIISF